MGKYVDSTVAIFGTAEEAGDTVIRLDPETGALVTVPWEHYLIHKGLLYSISHFSASVAKDAYTDFVVLVGDRSLHVFKGRWWTTGTAYMDLYGGVQMTPDTGTRLMPVNMHIPLDGGLRTRFYADPDLVSPGVLSIKTLIPGGIHPWLTGGYHEFAFEYVVHPEIPMLVRVTNKAGVEADISWQIIAYEDPGE